MKPVDSEDHQILIRPSGPGSAVKVGAKMKRGAKMTRGSGGRMSNISY
jgi:hypothetical protein